MAYERGKKESIMTALKAYQLLSSEKSLNADKILMVKKGYDYYTLLKIWTDSKLILNINYSAHCLQILKNLLTKDSNYHKELM